MFRERHPEGVVVEAEIPLKSEPGPAAAATPIETDSKPSSPSLLPILRQASKELELEIESSRAELAQLLTQEPGAMPPAAVDDVCAASASAAPTLRVLTLNVHGWHVDGLNDAWAAPPGLIALLRRADPDVIALQEATRNRVPPLAHALGNYHWLFQRNTCLLSKHELIATTPGHTAGCGRKQKGRSPSHKEMKGGCHTRHCVGRLAGPDGIQVEVVCVHLDHQHEPRRLAEVAKLSRYLAENGSAAPTARRVWTGDFNALTRSDYSDGVWAEIADSRARNAWEPPMSELTHAIARAPTKKAPLGLGMLDARDAAPPEQRFGPLGTSRFDTRIDYVFVSPALAPAVASCEHVVAIPNVSDHNAVMVTFDLSQLVTSMVTSPGAEYG